MYASAFFCTAHLLQAKALPRTGRASVAGKFRLAPLLIRLFFCWTIVALLSSLSLQAQTPYAAQWAEIDSLIDSVDQPRLAQVRLEALMQRADRDGQDPMYLKAFLRRLSLYGQLEPAADSIAVAQLEAAIQSNRQPARKAILHLALAQTWTDWYQRNMQRLYRRLDDRQGPSRLAEEPTDFRQWGILTFQQRIFEQYEAALSKQETLARLPARAFVRLLDTAAQSDRYRPSLYDLVAHTVMDGFSQGYFGVDAANWRRDFPPSRLLADRRAFLQDDFSGDSSVRVRSFQLIQSFVRFRDNQGDPYPLVQADLRRMEVLRKMYSQDQAEAAYLKALETLAEEYYGHPVQAEVGAAQAYFLWKGATEWLKRDARTAYDQRLVQAHARAREMIATYPDTRGAQTCQQVIEAIEKPKLSFAVERFIVPNAPYRARLSYRNLDKVYFRAIRLSPTAQKQWGEMRRDEEKARNFLRRQPYRRAWNQSLPLITDYYPRSTEIAMPPLDPGEYIILASEDARFSTQALIFASSELQATRMTFEMLQANNALVKVLLRDRKKGQPIVRQRVALYRNARRETDRAPQPDSLLYTDKQGAIFIPNPADNSARGFELKTRRGSDQLIFAGYSWRENTPSDQVLAHIFTDRAIYRPGQAVYAKVLLYQKKGDQYQVLANQAVDIEFRDVNGEIVEKRPLQTNGYGSAHTSFVAPDDRLLGRMSLRAMNHRANFRVEEYKRPSFKVTVEVDSALLGDSVYVSGLVKSYAGVPLSQTEVVLQFESRSRVPYWFRRFNPDRLAAPGYSADLTVTTNGKGRFSARFRAPSQSATAGIPAIYSLSIEATATDIAGETQVGQTQAQLSSLGYEATLVLPETIDKSLGGNLQIDLRATVSGKGIKRNVVVQIAPVERPIRPLRPRDWSGSNVFALDKEAYKKLFPYDVYDDTELQANWPTGVPLISSELRVDSSLQWPLEGLQAAPPGLYRLRLFIPDDSITLSQEFTLINPYQKRSPIPTWLEAKLDTQRAQPGQTIFLHLSTTQPEVWTRLMISQKGAVATDTLLRIPRGQTRYPIQVTEKHRGGFHLKWACFIENAHHEGSAFVQVPWTNKALSLNWTRIRRKLGPGEETEWELALSGPQAEISAAEMVGTLYDASLAAFTPHRLSLYPYPTYQYLQFSLRNQKPSSVSSRSINPWPSNRIQWPYPADGFQFTLLNLHSWPGRSRLAYESALDDEMMVLAAPSIAAGASAVEKSSPDVYAATDAPNAAQSATASIPLRSDFRETAFWGPQLQTDAAGRIKFRFTMPEALTSWRFLGWAHTKDMQIGTIQDEVITQKDLMITTNLPRFFRAKDKMTLQARIDNRGADTVAAEVWLELVDPVSGRDVAADVGLDTSIQIIMIPAEAAGQARWSLQIPTDISALQVRAYARGGKLTDAEEHTLPVLPNRALVRESQPFFVPAGRKKAKISFDKLLQSGRSKTLEHRSLTLDFSSNPSWYAVKALPYLMEFPHECTEQVFSRFYAHTVANHLLRTQPRLAAVFQQWRELPDSSGFMAQLEQSPELKSLLIAETPWVGAAQNERQRRRHLATLFDPAQAEERLARVWASLKERQADNGSLSWFPGLGSNRYITQLVATGLGELLQADAVPDDQGSALREWLAPTLRYLDRSILRDYNAIQIKGEAMEEQRPGPAIIQYLYLRTHFRAQPFAEGASEAHTFFLQQATRYWGEQSPYMQAMLAMVAFRSGNLALADLIMASLTDKAVQDPEKGMYWVQSGGYLWYEAPLDQQAMLIRAYAEVNGDPETLDALKQWLLQHKRGNDWGNTRATVAATQALLTTGSNWLLVKDKYSLELGGELLPIKNNPTLAAEAGTGHTQLSWAGAAVKPNMGKLLIRKRPKTPVWGALHWQYSEALDQITEAQTALRLERKLYKEQRGPQGRVLVAVDSTELLPGDEVIVRLLVRADRELEYVHLKDMRAAGLDLIEALSGPRYQDGLSYYQQQNDAAVHFFFDRLPAGQWVLEYPLRVRQAGDFSHGISTLECMYAPEFRAQSGGIRVQVEHK